MAEITKRATGRGGVRYDARVWVDGRGVMTTFRRRKDAEVWAAETEVRRNSGSVVDPASGRLTVSQLAAAWLRSTPGKRASTFARDRSIIERHIEPSLGNRRIGTLRQPDVQQLVTRLGESLAPNTAARIHAVLHAMFVDALNADLLARSPCRNINLPRGVRRNARALDVDDVAAIASAISERYCVMIWLAAMLGLRRGEVAAIKVGSVDVLERRLTVRETGGRDRQGRPMLGPPKSTAGVRGLARPQALAVELGPTWAGWASRRQTPTRSSSRRPRARR